MIDVAVFIAVCKTALSGGSRVYEMYRKKQLSKKEVEILIPAAKDGQMWILKTSLYGSWLRSGRVDFFKQEDRAHQALYMDAFRSLCERGYVSHAEGILFGLTGVGFEHARELAGWSDTSTPPQALPPSGN